ncbi:HD domain-containing phosphohydrolase [Microbulbifer rhizosphaerae]|uniref:HD-GYP domain-containing protein (C-di-GMP phosphodiesterase class II) n=1 Tax=Microbulbifer rhizosphaerae TaxID=1562603 RepID=A0A7W4WB17_9GAMM|nr:HD-GYP domain-containing protein (c-di-GMP phosphodiesterase class II) [Microbulbifer rhizosphaerae]
MAIQQAKVLAEDLQRGMFVSRLDRPWTHTPFVLQGFYIRDLEEIRQLQKFCRFVYVDVIKSVGDVGVRLRRLSRTDVPRGNSAAGGARNRRPAPVIPCRPVQVSHDTYPAPAPVQSEAGNARNLHRQILSGMNQVMAQICSDKPLQLKQINKVVGDLVESVLRSPDAFAWLARVREKDEHTYSHSLRASIWSLVFGRHIGLRRRELMQLALATLLKDVGKLRLSPEVLRVAKRDPRAELEYRKFVDHSVQMLAADADMDSQVLDIVHCHCEQHDGSGYPRGLRGDRIPVLARMCGIVTFYDEITNPRGVEAPAAPSRAVTQLYDRRGTAFNEQLTVEFIQSIGLYPTGTQVELSTGEVAVVVEQTYQRRLKPKVMVVLDRDKRPLSEGRLFDMAAADDRRQKLIERGKLPSCDGVTIVQDLEPSRFPQVDVAAVRDSYLVSPQGLPNFLSRLLKR